MDKGFSTALPQVVFESEEVVADIDMILELDNTREMGPLCSCHRQEAVHRSPQEQAPHNMELSTRGNTFAYDLGGRRWWDTEMHVERQLSVQPAATVDVDNLSSCCKMEPLAEHSEERVADCLDDSTTDDMLAWSIKLQIQLETIQIG